MNRVDVAEKEFNLAVVESGQNEQNIDLMLMPETEHFSMATFRVFGWYFSALTNGKFVIEMFGDHGIEVVHKRMYDSEYPLVTSKIFVNGNRDEVYFTLEGLTMSQVIDLLVHVGTLKEMK